jgi:hypothetical protein
MEWIDLAQDRDMDIICRPRDYDKNPKTPQRWDISKFFFISEKSGRLEA